MSHKHLMLDLETLGTNHNAAIIQIAAVYFNPKTGKPGDVFNSIIDISDSQYYGQIDGQTVQWWIKQDDVVVKKVFDQNKAITLENGLNKFNKFLKPNTKIWCHATFDAPILTNAFKATKIQPKYHYRDFRDLRTLVQLSQMMKLEKPKDSIPNQLQHDAVSDCLYQIQYASYIINKILSSGSVE